MQLDDKMLDHVCELAKLTIAEDKRESMRKDLGAILSYMQMLGEASNLLSEEVSVQNAKALELEELRDDVCTASMVREDVLQNSPCTFDNQIAVPRTIGSEGTGK